MNVHELSKHAGDVSMQHDGVTCVRAEPPGTAGCEPAVLKMAKLEKYKSELLTPGGKQQLVYSCLAIPSHHLRSLVISNCSNNPQKRALHTITTQCDGSPFRSDCHSPVRR